ncbi:transcriptional regulator BetI [Marinovum sp. 2_MG-2023]|uniref:choline-binding transcriptional repressor BetI n=1 Tax=unclassified Marinovum TaxID=2647166 RepID=UPI0026E2DFFB|nr:MULTISPECIES: transcriptional regulator BetI [unclassified Marinovum]MDO6728770.1 transcriptional regulator BetI [Marinovum sp. 2_MG-2023]MDO6777814.1 transcriptional regulator BetI [Marinovum sp. 1_MG-2023]
MPKVGMQPIRRQALIEATIAEVGAKGTLDITVSAIAKRAGVSSALAHHYFGGKDQIFLATMVHILSAYGRDVRDALRQADTPRRRLAAIVEAGFSGGNFDYAVVVSWMNFYALALSSPEAARLLAIYQIRLRSNLRHALRPMVESPGPVAERIAAMIDGLYLREAQSKAPDGKHAIAIVMQQIDMELKGTAQ